jgi:predicted dehydrogenase
MTITPLILGSGRSGQAIAQSLACLNLLRPEMKIESPVWLVRGTSLTSERKKYPNPVLCISNPHGLHAEAILEADQAGYDAIVCEKPACVNLAELEKLRQVKTPTAILHVYRQMWGIQSIKQMLDENKFGDLISIEGRYWQASTAERALQRALTPSPKSWKDDPRLSGEYDTYLDVGTHWVDTASFLIGNSPSRINGWRSYINSESSHRDSHIQLSIDYPKGRAFASISKTYHGATNHFEVNVIGSKMSATWEFMKPDELFIGEGRDRRVLTRKDSILGSQHPPHHGMGWLEGYIEIVSRLFSEVYLNEKKEYPRLRSNLDTLEAMLRAEWH